MKYDFKEKIYAKSLENIEDVNKVISEALQKGRFLGPNHLEMVQHLVSGLSSIYTNNVLVPVLEDYHKELMDKFDQTS